MERITQCVLCATCSTSTQTSMPLTIA